MERRWAKKSILNSCPSGVLARSCAIERSLFLIGLPEEYLFLIGSSRRRGSFSLVGWEWVGPILITPPTGPRVSEEGCLIKEGLLKVPPPEWRLFLNNKAILCTNKLSEALRLRIRTLHSICLALYGFQMTFTSSSSFNPHNSERWVSRCPLHVTD